MVEVQLQEDGVLSYIPAGKAGEMGLNPIDLKCEWKQVQERLAADSLVMGETLGYSQVGKAGAFEALILSLVQVQLPQRKENKHLQKMI